MLVHYCRCSGANGPQLSSSKLEAGRIRPVGVLAFQGFGHKKMHSLFPASPQLLSITKPPNAGERVSWPSGRHDRVCFVCNSQQQPNICRQHPLLWGEHHGNICAILVVMFQVIMLPLEEGQALSADLPNLQNTLLEATVKGPIIQVYVGQGQVLDPTWVGNLAITLKRQFWPKDDE